MWREAVEKGVEGYHQCSRGSGIREAKRGAFLMNHHRAALFCSSFGKSRKHNFLLNNMVHHIISPLASAENESSALSQS